MNVLAVAACIFQLTLVEMETAPRSDVAVPRLRLEHETTMTEFQDAVEPGWGMRPDVFINVYTPASNQIFLMTAPGSYRNGRSIFDSLAHEYVHFIQVKYKGIPLEYFGDSEEAQAVAVQTAFRQKWGSRIIDDEFDCPVLK